MGGIVCHEPSEEEIERKAVEDIYHNLNGFWWDKFHKRDWLSSDPVGYWKGVVTEYSYYSSYYGEMRGKGRVLHLDLSGRNERKNIQMISLGWTESMSGMYRLPVLDCRPIENCGPLGTPVNLTFSIGNLKYLQTLKLRCNNIRSIPDSIGNLKYLQTLDLIYNNITTIPDGIWNLENLQELKLSFNNITSISDSIGNLKHLKSLNLSKNDIITIPWEKLKELSHLSILWLSDNVNLKGNQDDVNGLGFIKYIKLPYHIPKPPPIHYPGKKLNGFKHKLLTSVLAITSFADIISDIFTAISMINISTPMFIGQVILIAFPGVYMSFSAPNPIKKFWFAIGLGSLYEYLKAIYTGIEDGELMEF